MVLGNGYELWMVGRYQVVMAIVIVMVKGLRSLDRYIHIEVKLVCGSEREEQLEEVQQ
jgi:hypothetical protein